MRRWLRIRQQLWRVQQCLYRTAAFEDAHGAVPDHGLGIADRGGESFNGFGTNIEAHHAFGNRVDHLGIGAGLEFSGYYMI